MNDPIYTVTAVSRHDGGRSRTFGWFPTLRRARAAVVNDEGGMNEAGYYSHIVIESIKPGIHREAVALEWYKYSLLVWSRVEEAPRGSMRVTNWAMG